MLELVENVKNNIDFSLRQKFKISRKGFFILNENKENLMNFVPFETREQAEEKEKEYFNEFNLNNFKDNSSIRNYLENLYILELLDSNFTVSEPKFKYKSYAELIAESEPENPSQNPDINEIKILDIGSKNWFYAPAQHHFFKWKNGVKHLSLTGIELDAYRVYTSMFSRYDAAKFYTKDLESTNYIAGDLLEHNEKYDFITWFFPFVTKYPFLKWGSPLKHFLPEIMLKHAYDLLKENGQMLIMNQGVNEYEIQLKLLRKLHIPFVEKGQYESCFYKHETERYYTLITKEDAE